MKLNYLPMGLDPTLFTHELDQNNDSLAANCEKFLANKKASFLLLAFFSL
jgi:hypothetical protein